MIQLERWTITSDTAPGLVARSAGADRWTIFLCGTAVPRDRRTERCVLAGRSLNLEQAVRALQLAELAHKNTDTAEQWTQAGQWAAALGLSVVEALSALGIDANIPPTAAPAPFIAPRKSAGSWWRR